MESITIEIENTPISTNMMYRTFRNRMILSKRGRQYKKDMIKHIENELIKQNITESIKGNIKVDISIHFCDKRKRDIDNYAKSLIDCIKNILFEDDDQIIELNLKKQIGCGYEKTIISVTQLS